jgi:hypothetical protein
MSIYEDRPPKRVEGFAFANTGEGASMTGRTLWRVTCLCCGIVVHDGTTGPRERAEAHILRCTAEGYPRFAKCCGTVFANEDDDRLRLDPPRNRLQHVRGPSHRRVHRVVPPELRERVDAVIVPAAGERA